MSKETYYLDETAIKHGATAGPCVDTDACVPVLWGIYIYIYIYIYVCICICVCVCMYVCMYVYICIYICIHTYIYIYIHMCVSVCVYIYIYTYAWGIGQTSAGRKHFSSLGLPGGQRAHSVEGQTEKEACYASKRDPLSRTRDLLCK